MNEASKLIPANAISAVTARDIQPGMLIIRDAAYGHGPYLTGCTSADDEDSEESKFLLPLSTAGDHPHTISGVPQRGGVYLIARKWRLLVDPATSFTGARAAPQPGDAFISNGSAGIVGRSYHVEAYVTLAGDRMEEPDWSGNSVGFKSWSIVVDADETESSLTLVERRRD